MYQIKRELSLYFLLMLLITTLSYNEFVSRNQQTTKTLSFNLQNNQPVEIAFRAKIFITEGEGQSVVIEGPDKLLSSIKVKEDDDKLRLSYSGIYCLNRLGLNGSTDQIQVYVNLKDLALLSFTEKAEIISSDFKPLNHQALERPVQHENITWFQSGFDLNSFDISHFASKITEKAFHRLMLWLLPSQLKSYNAPVQKSRCCDLV